LSVDELFVITMAVPWLHESRIEQIAITDIKIPLVI
jgi:hypothetical protein